MGRPRDCSCQCCQKISIMLMKEDLGKAFAKQYRNPQTGAWEYVWEVEKAIHFSCCAGAGSYTYAGVTQEGGYPSVSDYDGLPGYQISYWENHDKFGLFEVNCKDAFSLYDVATLTKIASLTPAQIYTDIGRTDQIGNDSYHLVARLGSRVVPNTPPGYHMLHIVVDGYDPDSTGDRNEHVVCYDHELNHLWTSPSLKNDYPWVRQDNKWVIYDPGIGALIIPWRYSDDLVFENLKFQKINITTGQFLGEKEYTVDQYNSVFENIITNTEITQSGVTYDVKDFSGLLRGSDKAIHAVGTYLENSETGERTNFYGTTAYNVIMGNRVVSFVVSSPASVGGSYVEKSLLNWHLKKDIEQR